MFLPMTARKLGFNAALAIVSLGLAVSLGSIAFLQWRSARESKADSEQATIPRPIQDGTTPARVGAEARKNLGLVSKPLTLTTYLRRVEFPGVVVDRPGVSDRGVIAPVTGVVTQIHAHPGSYVEPALPLFTLRLVSDALQTSQLELFKATKEIEIAKQQKKRLTELAATGGLAGSRLIEIDNQIERMDVNVQAYRQSLRARGLPQASIDAAAKGEFVTEIIVRAPSEQTFLLSQKETPRSESNGERQLQFEFQSLSVELGQQVEAGEVLCMLADHRKLLLEGRGFKNDLPLIQKAAKKALPIEIALENSEGGDWPALPKSFSIQHVANLIDPASRTFAFFLPLENQQQVYEQDGKTRVNWRFRPGDRLRISVGVAELKNVFVLPQAAVVRDGPEAYVFRQNGDLFDRVSVHMLHEDSTSIVIANDGKLTKGAYVAQNAAASLNRVLKAQLASGQPTNVHVHADGTTHAAH
jgi:membrane fusion protein, heavy metal efflux system